MPVTQKATPVSEWKRAAVTDPIELPSGKKLRVRRSSFRQFMAAGIIPNSLMGVVQKSMAKGKADVAIDEMTGDPAKLLEMMSMIDNVVAYVALDPKVYLVPKDEDGHEIDLEDREDQDVLYVDEIDEEDKQYIFQWSTGGVSDLEQFRRESADDVATLSRRPAVALPAKRAPRNRR